MESADITTDSTSFKWLVREYEQICANKILQLRWNGHHSLKKYKLSKLIKGEVENFLWPYVNKVEFITFPQRKL